MQTSDARPLTTSLAPVRAGLEQAAGPAQRFETIFEAGAWRRCLEQSYGYRYAPLRLRPAQGGSATINSYEVGRRLSWFRVLCSTPPYYYGSLRVEGPLTAQALASVARQVCRKPELHSLTLAIHPLDPCAPLCEAAFASHVLSRTATHILDLTALRASAASQAFSRNQRKKINKALSRGVTVTCSDNPADLNWFYPIYQDAAARWGLAAIEPKARFLALQQHLAPHYALWLALAEDEVIAGLIVLSHGPAAYSLYGASLSSCWHLYPNNLLYSAAIEAACAEGRLYFDFLPSGRLPGVEAFKESFGAQRMPFVVYCLRSIWYSAARRFVRRLLAPPVSSAKVMP